MGRSPRRDEKNLVLVLVQVQAGWCRCSRRGRRVGGAGAAAATAAQHSAAQRNGNGNGEQVDGEWWVCRLQCMSACAVQAAVHEDGASTVCLLGWFFFPGLLTRDCSQRHWQIEPND